MNYQMRIRRRESKKSSNIELEPTMNTNARESSNHLNPLNLDNSVMNDDGLNEFTQSDGNQDDYPNEICLSSSRDESYFNGINTSYTDALNESTLSDHNKLLETWKMNYHEAAIYLEEGLNNDKFDCHPTTKEAIPLYLLVHSTYFYILDLFASLLLMLLVLCEDPAIKIFQIPVYVHALLELFALSIIAIELFLKYKWMGAKHFFNHTRTTIKLATLVVMIIEAIVIMIRLDSHFRVSRAARPVFLIDNFYCGGIRRFIRQMIQSLPPILDMLILLFFFLLASALFAFYLFSSNPDDPYFKTFTKSFISLFVLVTTANFPDVMMPSYYKSRYSSLFFISFLVISLYLLMNLMLAVVYEIFTRLEKEKFRKLMLHRRLACQHAFRLLVPKSSPNRISFKHFHGMLCYYSSHLSKLDKYLMFKTLDTENSGKITLNQFYDFYTFIDLKWSKNEIATPFYMQFNSKLIVDAGNLISKIVKQPYFDVYVYVTIALSIAWQLVETNFPNKILVNGIDKYIHLEMSTVSLIIIILFTIELLMKIIAYDLKNFLKDYWNLFDFVIIIASIIGLVASAFNLPFAFIYVLRCVRLLKLFELRASYRNIMDSFMLILIKRFMSVTIVVLIVLYSFAILGMELFSDYDLRDCCQESEYAANFRTGKNDTENGYYYLNNFENVLISYVTLFQLMVANDWQVIMEGFVILYSPWCRAYFMLYYLVTMIMITIVIAFVLEAFLFRIQYKTKLGSIEQDTKIIADVNLSQNEYEYCMLTERLCDQTEERWRKMSIFIESGGELPRNNNIETIHCFHGEKLRTKFLFSLLLYAEEVANWVREFDYEEDQKRREYDLRLIRVSKRCMSY